MRYRQKLPIWKRAVIVVQAVTLPLWLLPYCLYVGIREVFPDVIPSFYAAWVLVSAPLADREAR